MMNVLAFAASQHSYLRDRIRALEQGIDEETLADTVEGLTDLHEIIAAVMRSALDDEALVGALKDRIGTMRERLERLEMRATSRREIVRDVMAKSEIKKVTAPEFTISIRAGAPSLIVHDESSIPVQYWVPRDPRLDRLAVISELKQGNQIEGCQLSLPQPILCVRVR